MEKHSRTIFKTASWRILATSTTLILVYMFTKNIAISASVGMLETISKTILYYAHERLWNKTNYGLTSKKPLQNSDFPIKKLNIQKENNR